MRLSPFLRALSRVAILAVMAPHSALAASVPDGTALPTGIVSVANSPLVLTTCKITRNPNINGIWTGNVVVGNRTKHVLSSASIVLVVYDVENTRLQQQTINLAFNQPVQSRETESSGFGTNFPGDEALLRRVTCRVQSATFSANKNWTYPQNWPEKNLTLMADDMGVDEGGGGAAAPQKSAAPRVQIAVTNAWVDAVNGVTFVHDALAITGGNADVQLRGSDFVIALSLANGARKTYLGLSQAAPTYQKINPLGSQTTTAYEVEPGSDLGRLGTITVPAHGSVTTTVTFGTSDPVNTSDIRTVTLK